MHLGATKPRMARPTHAAIHARIFICVHLCPSVAPFSPHVKLLEVAEPSGQAPKPPKVSALVVSYNRKALLRRALEALERSEARDTIEIVVVDNGSTDGSQQLESDFPRARFIRIPRNFGLTKALNLGVRGSEAEYVFFLHEDTEVFPDTTRLLAALLDSQPDAGAVCPLLVDDADRPAPQLGKFPPDDTWRPAEPGPDPLPVDYPRGAALMIRRHFFTAIRQIDERYGQFGSDADLCFQLRRAGKKILLLPQARARHQGRASPTASRAPQPGPANTAASGAVCGRRSPRSSAPLVHFS